MNFDQYYKTSKKLDLRKYARKVPNLLGTYSSYEINNLDRYDKPANCSICVKFVDYNDCFVVEDTWIDVYAPSVFNEATVILAYNPYKDYMFEIWNDIIFLQGKQIGKIPESAFEDSCIGQEGYLVYKDFKFYDPFTAKRDHNLASISNKRLKKYKNKLNNNLDILIHDYVEVYTPQKYPLGNFEFRDKYNEWGFGFTYTTSALQRDVNKKVLGEFDSVDSLKDFLIKKNLKSKKIDKNERLIDLIEDYFVRTHIMKIDDKYYIDFYDVIRSGDKYERPLEI